MSNNRKSARRRLIGAAVFIVAAACLVLGFTVPLSAPSDGLPRSITVDGVAYDRIDLVTLRTGRGDPATVEVSVTSRPIVVRASCRVPVLHLNRATSALMLELPSTRTGGDVASVPDTRGAEYLVCRDNSRRQLMTTIDPVWLPRDGQLLRMRWHELPTLADTPSDSPASWALAVYRAR